MRIDSAVIGGLACGEAVSIEADIKQGLSIDDGGGAEAASA